MTSDLACEFDGVTKAYKDSPVIDNISFTIASGEMVALTGPSGSGKSTILNMLGLLEPPDVGAIRLFGSPAPKPRTRAAGRYLRTRLGYLFQNYALIDQTSVEENLAVAQRYTPGSPSKKRLARTEALERVGLESLRRNRVYTLSGGEQQRVALARLLLKPCGLILADEPTGSLDAANRDRILSQLQQINATGTTVVIVTHDHAVSAGCGRTISLESRTLDRRAT